MKPTDVVIPVETAPGEIAQVDFVYAGKIYDPARGPARGEEEEEGLLREMT